jgi:cell division protein FtsB
MPLATASRAAPQQLRSPGLARERAAPGGVTAGAGVRWDRLGRVALLFVLGALLYLYLSAGIHVLSKWAQARHDSAAVGALKHEHTLLLRQHEALGKQATLEAQARQLGMIKAGEQPFIATGLPSN